MFPFERYEIILEACRKTDLVAITDLVAQTGCSISTLRRDINHLLQEKRIKKFRGGISINPASESNHNYQYANRTTQFFREKEAIGQQVQHYIEDGDIVVLLYGTTTVHVARQIDPEKNITVITNGLDVVNELRDKPNVKVIVLGGAIDYSNNCIEGPTVARMLKEFNPSKTILGAGGITEEKGVTNYFFLGGTFVSDIVALCEEIIIVADHSKFGRNALTNVMPFKKVKAYVTDSGISAEYIEKFEKYRIQYAIAPV